MNALGLLMRRSLGVHGRAAIGLAVVVALAGGLSLATFAAARRTASALHALPGCDRCRRPVVSRCSRRGRTTRLLTTSATPSA